MKEPGIFSIKGGKFGWIWPVALMVFGFWLMWHGLTT